jgi:DNA-directed RNA polymerase specialized sigma24 family protein
MLRLRKPPTSQETFEDLIQVHLDGLYGAALRYTRQPQAAEDLVHDTVVRALRFQREL